VISRQQLLDDLSRVESHIASSEMNISAQRGRVEAKSRTGDSTVLSLSVLANFEISLRLHYDHRDRILRDLEG
jgi:hypothetical protein